MPPKVKSLDHLVLTVSDLTTTTEFYKNLGMSLTTFTDALGISRYALNYGEQKINLHIVGEELLPNASRATPGSADLCFLSDATIKHWQAHFASCGIHIIEGPVQRTGATGPINSIYVRDPDGNLVEISNPI